MKINKINPNYLVNAPSKISLKNPLVNASGLNCDSVSFCANWINGSTMLSKITGLFSKEELKQAAELYKTFQKLSDEKCADLKQEILSQSFNLLKTSGIKYKQENNTELYDYNPTFISNKLKNELKNNALKIYALNQLIYKSALDLQNKLPEVSETIIPLPHTVFEHPVEKVLRITGGFTKEDEHVKSKTEKKYSNLGVENIFRRKLNLIDAIQKILKEKRGDFSDSYSNNDFTCMKKLAIEYSALDNLQKSKGCYTKDLEKVIYSSKIARDIKSGDSIDGLGTVINRLNTDDREAIIVISGINKSKMLRMYNLEVLNKKSKFEFNRDSRYSIEELNELNNKAKDLTQNEKGSLMSEIRFSKIPSKTFSNISTKDRTVKEILNKHPQAYFVTDFVNYDTKKYSKAAKIIALELMKLFSEKQFYPVFLRAQAFNGSRHSPVNYYRYYGFAPFSHTEEEIEKITAENDGSFPYDIPVYMYLKDFEAINYRLKLWQSVYDV